MKESTKKFVDNLDSVEKDALYRYLWEDYVKEDVESRLNENFDCDNLTEDQIDIITNRVIQEYVYDGNYDCNLTYWTNIDNLIKRAMESEEITT